jgi:excisionase family DNA binding protein
MQYLYTGLVTRLSLKLFIGEDGEKMTHYERISNMLTTGEVARLLNVHPSTVRRWSDRKVIKAYRIGPRGERRYQRDDIAVFLLNRAVTKYLK